GRLDLLDLPPIATRLGTACQAHRHRHRRRHRRGPASDRADRQGTGAVRAVADVPDRRSSTHGPAVPEDQTVQPQRFLLAATVCPEPATQLLRDAVSTPDDPARSATVWRVPLAVLRTCRRVLWRMDAKRRTTRKRTWALR